MLEKQAFLCFYFFDFLDLIFGFWIRTDFIFCSTLCSNEYMQWQFGVRRRIPILKFQLCSENLHLTPYSTSKIITYLIFLVIWHLFCYVKSTTRRSVMSGRGKIHQELQVYGHSRRSKCSYFIADQVIILNAYSSFLFQVSLSYRWDLLRPSKKFAEGAMLPLKDILKLNNHITNIDLSSTGMMVNRYFQRSLS